MHLTKKKNKYPMFPLNASVLMTTRNGNGATSDKQLSIVTALLYYKGSFTWSMPPKAQNVFVMF